jgi:hypothetical protein
MAKDFTQKNRGQVTVTISNKLYDIPPKTKKINYAKKTKSRDSMRRDAR